MTKMTARHMRWPQGRGNFLLFGKKLRFVLICSLYLCLLADIYRGPHINIHLCPCYIIVCSREVAAEIDTVPCSLCFVGGQQRLCVCVLGVQRRIALFLIDGVRYDRIKTSYCLKLVVLQRYVVCFEKIDVIDDVWRRKVAIADPGSD